MSIRRIATARPTTADCCQQCNIPGDGWHPFRLHAPFRKKPNLTCIVICAVLSQVRPGIQIIFLLLGY
ncbi:unnamed protein product [Fusarium graminearum]|uniref:Chromosome 1, complete genome n=1 Tax=Gibberella zeae (strain ATCC MYA-4620 / CBS 123657 / FGSC 9075 / NRRL 31084 / PH-1) TaxID=229533 RepID=A0A0E0RPD6_GIBZE|nr:hypothetical protein FG05_30037 [Fusarium graminearum]CEF73111.1 unnamed protein product [Fusarium graminearum]CZS76377.1 unnamed protein product [Fusarium graminearum]